MPRAFALDHIVLVVSDVEQSLEWYGQYAGLEELRVDEWRRGEVLFPSLRVDAVTIIDLIAGAPEQRGHLDHICFVVSQPDLDALAAHPDLTVDERGERFGAQGLGESIYVRDPDGLLVEFRAYTE